MSFSGNLLMDGVALQGRLWGGGVGGRWSFVEATSLQAAPFGLRQPKIRFFQGVMGRLMIGWRPRRRSLRGTSGSVQIGAAREQRVRGWSKKEKATARG